MRLEPGLLATPRGYHCDLGTMIDEVVNREVYTRGMPELTSDSAVVDIGANVGVFTLACALKGARVWACEPHPQNVACLIVNMGSYGVDTTRLKVLPAAVTGEQSPYSVPLYESAHAGGHLLFDRSGEGVLTDHLQVPAVSLASLLAAIDVPQITLLKIDAEGAEGLMLPSVTDAELRRCRHIAMEYHDNVSPMSHTEIITRLQAAGYTVAHEPLEGPFGHLRASRR